MSDFDASGYAEVRPEGLMRDQAVAAFLAWASSEAPQEILNYREVLKNAMGYSRFPREGNAEVGEMKRGMTNVRRILEREYKKGLVTLRSCGVRATTDSFDYAQNCLGDTGVRVNNLRKRAQFQLTLIDAGTFPKNAEGREMAERVHAMARNVSLMIKPAFLKGLVPESKVKALLEEAKKGK